MRSMYTRRRRHAGPRADGAHDGPRPRHRRPRDRRPPPTERNLLAIPVVDDEDHLLGIITEDDVADVLEAEATEDIERLGGSQPLNVPYRLSSVSLLVRKRIGWLLLLFVAEAYTGTVLRLLGRARGGRRAQLLHPAPDRHRRQHRQPDRDADRPGDGAQRGLAARRRLDRLEGAPGRAGPGRDHGGRRASVGRRCSASGSNVGLVVAITILAICLWSATVAAVLPLALRRLRIDPAVVSAPLITTLVDGTGPDHLLRDRQVPAPAVT